jgi:phage terminase small subunit
VPAVTRRRKNRAVHHFRATFYVRAYELASIGRSNHQIADQLVTSYETLKMWIRVKPAFKEAIEKGRGKWQADGGLKPRYRIFAKEYVTDLNATQAAIRAGYSKKTAMTTAYRLLRKPEIQQIVQKEMKARCEDIELDTDWVLDRLKRIADSNLQDICDEDGNPLPIAKISKDLAYTIKKMKRTIGKGSVSHEYVLNSQLTALELLGKYLGMWVERREVEHSGIVITDLLDKIEHETPKIVDAEWLEKQALLTSGNRDGDGK